MSIEYGYNSKYMTKNGEPWFPIMGEIHYSRYPKAYWKESLYKMKAGGVEVVSSYTIWIHHEEIEGQYDFSGNKDLRTFVETIKECGLKMILRVGPWSHAEARNGGFPDWLLKKDFEPRTNDEKYFKEVEKFYGKIYEQVEGLLLKDGGPIIGLQIENEYGHCGGLGGEEGEAHMRRLTQIAKDTGFIVPIYTATGWGGAVTGGLLPVMGGYCEAPWDQRLTDIEPSGNYIFTHERNDHNIGSDHGFGDGITFDIEKFPYLTAELGGGLQVTDHRRPVAHSKDIGAMTMVKLGSGVNLLGYYMYHGGTNPKGVLTTLQESRDSGYLNDLPVFNYDFRTAVREYGQISENFKEIKLITMFTNDFGSELCEMPAIISEDNPLFPNNLTDLRHSLRHNGKNGYVFVNNFQRRYKMASHKNVELKVELADETITFPSRDVEDRDFFFYPFNLKVGDALIKSALATPLCKVNGDVVLYTDIDPQYNVEGDLRDNKIITISREEAKNAWKVNLDREYILITDSTVLSTDRGIEFISNGDVKVKAYPELPEMDGLVKTGTDGEFTLYTKIVDKKNASVRFDLVKEEDDKKTYEITIEADNEVNDCFLKIDYNGDKAKIFIDGEYEDDSFYTGESYEIGLKRYNYPKKIVMEIQALHEGAPKFLETWPPMTDGKACELVSISAVNEYLTIVK